MKRIWKLFLLTAAVSALFCISAYATDAVLASENGNVSSITHYSAYSETAGTSTRIPDKTGDYYADAVAFGLTYTDATATDGTYALVVVSTSNTAAGITANNILYINQYTFAESKITPVIYPRSVQTAYVYVSYAGSEGLKNIGQLTTDVILGDANDDGSVTNSDTLRIARVLAYIEGVTLNERAADVNVDGQISVQDLLRLARFLAHIDGVTLG